MFSPEQVEGNGGRWTLTYTWGHYDGTGFPHRANAPGVFLMSLFNTADFINAENVSHNETLGVGNTLENQFGSLPDAIIVEYHFSGLDPQIRWRWTGRSLRAGF